MTNRIVQSKAHRAVRAAIISGKLIRPEICSKCGQKPASAKDGRSNIHGHHHAGYDPINWLNVEWICANCHRKETPLPMGGGGVSHGEHNGASRLTIDQVAEIRASALSSRKLGAKLGVDKRTILRVRNGETWLSAAPALQAGEER